MLTIQIKSVDPHLCGRCQRGVVSFDSYGRRSTYCNAKGNDGVVQRSTIIECTAYQHPIGNDAYVPYELKEKAWVMERQRGKFIGFRPPEKKEGKE